MVEASDPRVQATIKRIARGRPPGDVPKSVLNKAIEEIEKDPALRARIAGGVPTGLSPERREAFIEREKELAGLSPAERERVEALGKLAEVEVVKREEREEPIAVETREQKIERIFGKQVTLSREK